MTCYTQLKTKVSNSSRTIKIKTKLKNPKPWSNKDLVTYARKTIGFLNTVKTDPICN